MHEMHLYYLKPEWCDEVPKVAGSFNGWQWVDTMPCAKPQQHLPDGDWFSYTTGYGGQVEFKFIAKGNWIGDHHGSNFCTGTSAFVTGNTLAVLPEPQAEEDAVGQYEEDDTAGITSLSVPLESVGGQAAALHEALSPGPELLQPTDMGTVHQMADAVANHQDSATPHVEYAVSDSNRHDTVVRMADTDTDAGQPAGKNGTEDPEVAAAGKGLLQGTDMATLIVLEKEARRVLDVRDVLDSMMAMGQDVNKAPVPDMVIDLVAKPAKDADMAKAAEGVPRTAVVCVAQNAPRKDMGIKQLQMRTNGLTAEMCDGQPSKETQNNQLPEGMHTNQPSEEMHNDQSPEEMRTKQQLEGMHANLPLEEMRNNQLLEVVSDKQPSRVLGNGLSTDALACAAAKPRGDPPEDSDTQGVLIWQDPLASDRGTSANGGVAAGTAASSGVYGDGPWWHMGGSPPTIKAVAGDHRGSGATVAASAAHGASESDPLLREAPRRHTRLCPLCTIL